ncbi:uncharacterized protein strat [Dermacentor andersoni]|uniref:uncharacterized protein strat n=1 Tax=Dermacentor andersoni TaxID=34620 RepID=UPI00241732EA|nr:uncharacterized protein LOC126547855 [Dermacentor andersoni]
MNESGPRDVDGGEKGKDQLVENGKNKVPIECKYCSSRILNVGVCELVSAQTVCSHFKTGVALCALPCPDAEDILAGRSWCAVHQLYRRGTLYFYRHGRPVAYSVLPLRAIWNCSYDLPTVDGDSKMVEKLTDFWCVNDIYTFENIGFTNTVGQTKYLACADCERGPVGWHSLETRKSFVALSRVRHL